MMHFAGTGSNMCIQL